MKQLIKKIIFNLPYIKKSYNLLNFYKEKYYFNSCVYIDRFAINIFNSCNIDKKCLRMCCEPFSDVPDGPYINTPEETILNYVKLRSEIISESIKFSLFKNFYKNEDRKYTAACLKCSSYKPDNWKNEKQLHYINISIYAPCQCKCIYCDFVKNNINDIYNKENFEKIIKMLEYALLNELVAKDATWQISTGEITINPFKDRLYEMMKDKFVYFYTNCFTYDEKISSILSTNSKSHINLSIDSGTSETWFKIKGVDNFENVINNLYKYKNNCLKNEQITLKYIVLPEINDNLIDYNELIKLMKKLKISDIMVSCDNRYKYKRNNTEQNKLVKAAGELIILLIKNKFTYQLDKNGYTQDEISSILTYLDDLIK